MKKINNLNDDQREIVNFGIILGVIIVIVLVIYWISNSVKAKNEYHYADVNPGEINYNKVNFGTMFSQNEKEYYVVMYGADDENALYYSSLIGIYASKSDALKVYYCDINNPLNKDYVAKDGKTNPKAKNLADLQVGEFTLIKIKDGKIVNYYEDIEKVKEDLNIN